MYEVTLVNQKNKEQIGRSPPASLSRWFPSFDAEDADKRLMGDNDWPDSDPSFGPMAFALLSGIDGTGTEHARWATVTEAPWLCGFWLWNTLWLAALHCLPVRNGARSVHRCAQWVDVFPVVIARACAGLNWAMMEELGL